MTLKELFESDEGDDIPDDFPWITITIPTQVLVDHKLLLNEGDWRPSTVKNLWYRVDAENPAQKQQRHVHVADKKHIKTPGQQVSWNQDWSRHDRHKFNVAMGLQKSYQSVAKMALDLPDNAILERQETRAATLTMLVESLSDSHPREWYEWAGLAPLTLFEELTKPAT